MRPRTALLLTAVVVVCAAAVACAIAIAASVRKARTRARTRAQLRRAPAAAAAVPLKASVASASASASASPFASPSSAVVAHNAAPLVYVCVRASGACVSQSHVVTLLHDLFAGATHPERVFVGVYLTAANTRDVADGRAPARLRDAFRSSVPAHVRAFASHIAALVVPLEEYRGAAFARRAVQQYLFPRFVETQCTRRHLAAVCFMTVPARVARAWDSGFLQLLQASRGAPVCAMPRVSYAAPHIAAPGTYTRVHEASGMCVPEVMHADASAPTASNASNAQQLLVVPAIAFTYAFAVCAQWPHTRSGTAHEVDLAVGSDVYHPVCEWMTCPSRCNTPQDDADDGGVWRRAVTPLALLGLASADAAAPEIVTKLGSEEAYMAILSRMDGVHSSPLNSAVQASPVAPL